jgi:hypothetical protein
MLIYVRYVGVYVVDLIKDQDRRHLGTKYDLRDQEKGCVFINSVEVRIQGLHPTNFSYAQIFKASRLGFFKCI